MVDLQSKLALQYILRSKELENIEKHNHELLICRVCSCSDPKNRGLLKNKKVLNYLGPTSMREIFLYWAIACSNEIDIHLTEEKRKNLKILIEILKKYHSTKLS